MAKCFLYEGLLSRTCETCLLLLLLLHLLVLMVECRGLFFCTRLVGRKKRGRMRRTRDDELVYMTLTRIEISRCFS